MGRRRWEKRREEGRLVRWSRARCGGQPQRRWEETTGKTSKTWQKKRCEEDAWQREEEKSAEGWVEKPRRVAGGGEANETRATRLMGAQKGHALPAGEPSHTGSEALTHAHTHISGGERRRLACSELSISALVSGSARAELPRRWSQPPR